jgi:hypothetical protein
MAGEGERVRRRRREGGGVVFRGERDCLCDFWSWLSASLGVMSWSVASRETCESRLVVRLSVVSRKKDHVIVWLLSLKTSKSNGI